MEIKHQIAPQTTRINKILDGIFNLVGSLSTFLIILLATFTTVLILSRHGLGTPIRGLFDVAAYVLITFSFLSSSYTLKEKGHITIDIVTYNLGEKGKIGLDLVSYTIGIIFPAILTWSSWIWAYDSFKKGLLTVSEAPVPRFILVGMITIGSILIIIQMIRIIIDRIADFTVAIKDKNTCKISNWKDNPIVYGVILIACILIAILLVEMNLMLGIFSLVVVLLFSGMPVMFALGLAGSVGLYNLLGAGGLSQTAFLAFRGVNSFPLSALPLFVLAGIILSNGRVVDLVLNFLDMITGRLVTGLLITTILVGGFFCAVSGSSVAATAIIATILLPRLFKEGFNKALSCGVVAGSTIGTVIPPSIGYIVFGVVTGTSIGSLFIAGVVPGIVIFGLYILYVILLSVFDRSKIFEGEEVKREIVKYSTAEKVKRAKDAVWGLVLPVLIIGGIYLGIFTPTEAAAVLVVYSIVICLFVTKSLNVRDIISSTVRSVQISSMILSIIISGMVLGAVISQVRLANTLYALFEGYGSPLVVLGFIFVVLVVLGMFIDSATILLITLPVFFPLAINAGFDPVWFGVFYIITTEIGLRTPPVGLNLFSITGVTGLPLMVVSRGSLPFLLILVLSLALMTIFPQIVLWLPGLR